jgi:histone H3/H4
MADDEISLPKATMTRIIKERLPEDMKISAEANEIIMRCCEEFVHMIAATANEVSEKEKKSTLTPEHILKSLEELGFTSYLDNLNAGKSIYSSWRWQDQLGGYKYIPCLLLKVKLIYQIVICSPSV